MNEPDFSKARVGERVVSLLNGAGVVTEVSGGGDYPIGVQFDDGVILLFTLTGRFNMEDPFPALYYSDVKITIEGGCEPPRRMVKKTVWQNLYFDEVHRFYMGGVCLSEDAADDKRGEGKYIGVVKREIEVDE